MKRAAGWAVGLALWASACGEARRRVPYSQLVEDVRAGRVESVVVCADGESSARYRYERAGAEGAESREAIGPPWSTIADELREHEVSVELAPDGC
ncbi:MAG TPA: hypothetical protein RMH99_24455 [Sandaracinaceae bacterium LLY-WYZ-13_1]|nr:hypothetical protein [Sandaracinaceae bacterium LLY-WYZ-13_1]